MIKFNKSPIARRLSISYCFLILIFVLFGTYTLYELYNIASLTRTIYDHPLVVSNAALQANVSITKMHRNMKDVVLFRDLQRINASVEAVNIEERQAYLYLDIVQNTILGKEGQRLEADARNSFRNWKPIREKVIRFVDEGRTDEAAEITIGNGAEHVILLEKKMVGLTNYARAKATEFMRETEEARSKIKWTSILFLASSLIIVSFVALWSIKQTASSEKKLKNSQRRYRSLIEEQTDLVCRFLPDGIFVFVNEVYCEFFKKSKEDLIGHKWHPLPVDNDLQMIENKLSQLSPANSTITIENRLYSGEGKIHWVQFVNRGIFNSAGKLLEIQSVGRDITERKVAEKNLREVLHFNEKILSVSPVGMGIYDAVSGQCVAANDALADLVGATKELVLGQNFYKIDSWKNSGLFTEAMDSIKQGVKKHLETELTSTFGKKVALDINAATFTHEGKKHLFLAATDITRRVKAERIVAEQKAEAERYLNLANVMFIGLDTEGNVNLANKKACKILECTEGEILGQNWFDNFIPENRRHKVRSVFNTLIDNIAKPVKYYENSIVSKSGVEKYIAWNNTFILDESDKITGVLASGEDITEKRRLQAQLQQSLKMESIGNLAGGIAHDFNNILASILGFTELALDDAEKGSATDDHLQEIYAAGKRARDLVKQILAFARQSDVETKPIKPAIIAAEVLKLIRSSIPTTIEIIQNIDTNALIIGDSTQFHQVLMNLCTNSAQAMETGAGKLKISLKDVRYDDISDTLRGDLKEGDYIEIEVSDTGAGISPEIIDNIFEPYFTTKGPGEGSGMGLAMAHGIVEAYGGKITVDSELGRGTTFTIYLPTTESIQAYEKYKTTSLPTGNERILFVDDEAPIVRIGSQILERQGYSVKMSTSSVDALEVFRSKPRDFDLVITDMTMPNMAGDQFASEIIKIRPDIPVILCTGYSKNITEEIAAKIGIKAFAYKPLVKADLVKTVRTILDQNKELVLK